MKRFILYWFKETRTYLRNLLVDNVSCPFGSAAGRNKLCMCVMFLLLKFSKSCLDKQDTDFANGRTP